MKKRKKMPQPEEQTLYYGNFPADPMGSYTGIPAPVYEVPVQDADDL